IASGPSQPSDIATAVDAAWTRPWRWSGVAATRAPEMIELTSGVRSSASATITPIRMAAWTTSSIGATAKRSQLPATSAARPLIRRRSGPLANAPSNPPVPGDREHHADRRRRGTALLGEQDREQVEAREKRVAGREQERRGAKVWPPPQPPEPLDRLAPAASLHSPCALARLEVRARQRQPDHRRQKRDCVGKDAAPWRRRTAIPPTAGRRGSPRTVGPPAARPPPAVAPAAPRCGSRRARTRKKRRTSCRR